MHTRPPLGILFKYAANGVMTGGGSELSKWSPQCVEKNLSNFGNPCLDCQALHPIAFHHCANREMDLMSSITKGETPLSTGSVPVLSYHQGKLISILMCSKSHDSREKPSPTTHL